MLEDPSALVLLLLLLPVIILYILKPKPKTLKMPSLMLLISRGKKLSLRSLFDTLIRDPLLLIQLAAITVLVLALANPYFFSNPQNENTVIVLDNSASMSSADVSPSHFSQAADIASGYIGNGKTSLILAGSTPLLLFKDADGEKAIRELKAQRVSSTGTDLNNAMLLAADLAESSDSKIVVISDFSGQDITLAQKTIEAKNISVDYRQVGSGGSNTGIVEASVESGSVKFGVKNYDPFAKEVAVKTDSGLSQTRTIKPGSIEFFISPAHPGKNTITLEAHDDMPADNVLYIIMPEILKKRVLILSDKVGKNPVSIALNSIPGVEVYEVAFTLAPRKPDHSMVVMYNYTKDSLLPGTLDDLRAYVERGGTLVIVATEDLPSMDLIGLLPVNVSERAKPSGFEVAKTDLTAGLDFGVSGYLNATLIEGAVELATAPEGPVLAYRNLGKGQVYYLGLNDGWGDFHLRASYPIFWYRLLGSTYRGDGNFKTGTVLPLGMSKIVSAPYGTIETSELYLGDSGFYDIGDRTVAANLLDEKESDISIGKMDNGSKNTYAIKPKKIHIDVLLSILAIILVASELFYLKRRGNI